MNLMNQREKLIELCRIAIMTMLQSRDGSGYVEVANYLLANGVVIVNRCKECEFCEKSYFKGETYYGCSNSSGLIDVYSDTFCSYNKRKCDEQND